MPSPKSSVTFWAPAAGADVAIAVGNVVLPDSDNSGNFVVATTANRGSRKSEGIAMSLKNGSGFGTFEIWNVGTIDASIANVGTSTQRDLVRCSATGTMERIAVADVDPDTDDLIGYAEADGRVHLYFGFPFAEMIALIGSGGGATPGGAKGTTQFHSSTDALLGADLGQPLEYYGATGDGVTGDQTAFEAARAALAVGTSDSIEIGADTYVVTGTADPSGNPFPFGVSIMGHGPKSVLKTDTNGPLIVFRSADSAERAKCTTLAFVSALGSGKLSGKTNQDAFRSGYLTGDGSSRMHAHGLYAKNMGGIGLIMAYTDKLGSGSVSTACRSESCDTGLVGTEGEAHGFQAIDCTIGVRVASGNFCMLGGSFEGCTTGYRVNAGGNDAHGMCVGTSWTHNTTAIYLEASTNGQYFTGCRVFDGAITIVNGNTKFHTIGDCLISGTALNLNGKARWLNVTFGTAYYTSSDFTNGENEFVNPRGEDGTIPSWIGQQHHCQVQYASNADKTLTTQQGWAEVIEVLAGSESAKVNLINRRMPSRGERQWLVNRSTQTVHYHWAGGDTGQDIPGGYSALIGFELAGANMVIYALADNTGAGGGGGGGAPVGAQYVTLATDGTLTNERVLTAGTGITITDGGAGGAVTISAPGSVSLPGSAGQPLYSDGAGGANAAANWDIGTGFVGGSGAYLSLGSTPGSTGDIRVTSGFSMVSSVGAVDRTFLQFDSGAELILGDNSTTANIINRTASGTAIYNQIGGTNYWTIKDTALEAGAPMRFFGTGAISQIVWKPASGDVNLIGTDGSGSGSILVGDVGVGTTAIVAANAATLYVSSANVVRATPFQIHFAQAISGDQSLNAPFCKKVGTITMTAGAGTATTASASVYECPTIEVTTTADGQQLILPAVSGADYHVHVVAGGNTTFWIRKTAGSGGVQISGSLNNHGIDVYYSPTIGDYVAKGAQS